MADHPATERLEGYRARTLGAADLLAVDDHVAACEACRGRLAEEGLDTAFAALRAEVTAGAEPTHLTYEQIERHVEGGLDDVEREIAEAHLEACTTCALEMQDLLGFKASLVARRAPTPQTPIRRFAFPVPAFRWLLVPAAAALIWGVTLLFRTGGEHAGYPASQAQSSQQPPAAIPAIRIALDDGGGQVTMDANGQLAGLPALSAKDEKSVRAALEAGRLEAPGFLAGLGGKRGTLLGPATDAGSFGLVGPVGTAVETERPTLRWQPLEGASSYTASVFDASLNPVATSPALRRTEWAPTKGLARGRDYVWQVTALKDGREVTAPAPPAPEARFRVLDEATAEEVRRSRNAYSGSHLMLGLVYARAGLLHEAEHELEILVKDNPASPLPGELLKQVRTLGSDQLASPIATKPAQ